MKNDKMSFIEFAPNLEDFQLEMDGELEEIFGTCHLGRKRYLEKFQAEVREIVTKAVRYDTNIKYALSRNFDGMVIGMGDLALDIAESMDRTPAQFAEIIFEITKRKNEDYAMDDDAFSNFNYANTFGIHTEDAILTFISTKIARYVELVTNGKAPNNESVLDTKIDLFVYLVIYRVYKDSCSCDADEEDLRPIIDDISNKLSTIEPHMYELNADLNKFIEMCDEEEDELLINSVKTDKALYKSTFKSLRSTFNV